MWSVPFVPHHWTHLLERSVGRIRVHLFFDGGAPLDFNRLAERHRWESRLLLFIFHYLTVFAQLHGGDSAATSASLR